MTLLHVCRRPHEPRSPATREPESAPLLPVPWTDRETARFTFRDALFKRRGCSPAEAETLADQLATRDRDRDDRRLCLECSHLQRDGGCFQARQGLLDPEVPERAMTPKQVEQAEQQRLRWRNDFRPLRTTLQRCASFTFQLP